MEVGAVMHPSAEHEVAAAIIVRGHSVLLCHRHPNRRWYPNVWDVPGGHIEPGESSAAAVVREVREELGVAIDLDSSEPFRVIHALPELSIDLWLVTSWNGEPVNLAPSEHDRVEWMDISRLFDLDLAHSSLTNAIVDGVAARRGR